MMPGMEIDPETLRRHKPTEEIWQSWLDVKELARRLARVEMAVADLRRAFEVIDSAIARPKAKPAFRAEEGGGV